MNLLEYLLLPKKMTEFEVNYLHRMNRVGLYFFWANLPVFVLVAFFNKTNPGLAVLLTTLTLAGPTAALKMFENPRHVSWVIGFTAMCMGGLLVHFGQGPMQIEMHFYFFSLLAVLAMFANPMVIVVAAVTVTFHHTVIWLLIPESVFNYDASIWVVAVHATFVVVESIAAVFIARSFFDNVIGLDLIVQERTAALDDRNRDMKLVLDNVNQGLFTINREAEVISECSAKVQQWLGVPNEETLKAYLEQADPKAAEWFDLSWEDVTEAFMPLEVTIEQLPSKFASNGRHFHIAYEPILDDGMEPEDFEKMLVVISDVTDQVVREESEAEQRETMQIFEHFLSDKSGFLEFFSEGTLLIRGLVGEEYGEDASKAKRWLHTLKGNSLMYGLERFGAFVHHLEDIMVDEHRLLTTTELGGLDEQWESIQSRLNTLLGERRDLGVELEEAQYEDIVHAVRDGHKHEILLDMIHSWKLEPISRRLERIATQARRIATSLGKEEVEIHVEDNAVHTDPDRFVTFWSDFVHIIRNALDHGIESAEERIGAGKSPQGRLSIKTWMDADRLMLDVEDDGRGIDWAMLSAKAADHGFACKTQDDLVDFMFRDGVSTKEEATEFSGRGVGLGAVRQSVDSLGGSIDINSTTGKGTQISFVLPVADRMAA